MRQPVLSPAAVRMPVPTSPRLTVRARLAGPRMLYDIHRISPSGGPQGYTIGELIEAGFTSRRIAAKRRDQIARAEEQATRRGDEGTTRRRDDGTSGGGA